MPIDFSGVDDRKEEETGIDFSGIDGVDFSGIEDSKPARWSAQSPSAAKMVPDTLDVNQIDFSGIQELQGTPVAPGMATEAPRGGTAATGLKELAEGPTFTAPDDPRSSMLDAGMVDTEDVEPGTFGRAIRGGVAETGKGLGTLTKIAGREMQDPAGALRSILQGKGAQWALKKGGAGVEKTGEWIEGQFKPSVEKFAPPEKFAGKNPVDNPEILSDTEWWKDTVGRGAPSMLASVLPAFAAGKVIKYGGKALSWTPQVIDRLTRLGSAVTGGTVGGGLEGAGTYEQALEMGMSEPEARNAAKQMTLVSAGLNALSVDKALGSKGTSVVGKLWNQLSKGLTEGVTEWAEEPAQAAILGQDIWQGMKEGTAVLPSSILLGSLIPGAGGRFIPAKTDQKTKTAETIKRIQEKLGIATPTQATQQPLSATPVTGTETPTKAVEPVETPAVQSGINIEGTQPGVTKNVSQSEAAISRARLEKAFADKGISPDDPLYKAVLDEHRNIAREYDRVTGYEPADYLDRKVERVIQTGQESSYGAIDLRNLGGFNDLRGGEEAANPEITELSNLIRKTIDGVVGKPLEYVRKGGDEFSVIAPGVPQNDLDRALESAKIEVDKWVQEKGLENLPHPKAFDRNGKRVKEDGFGIYYGTAPLKDMKSAYAEAEKYVYLQKNAFKNKEAKNAGGEINSKTVRPRTPVERPTEISRGNNEEVRGRETPAKVTPQLSQQPAQITPQPRTKFQIEKALYEGKTVTDEELSKHSDLAKKYEKQYNFPMTSKEGAGDIPTKKNPEQPEGGKYKGRHRPVTVEGGAARLDDLTPAFGEDIYGENAVQYFGTGNDSLDRQTLRVLKFLKGNPGKEVAVYRAIPKDASFEALSSGDWVTVNKQYAEMHGESTLEGYYKIVSQKVLARDLTTNADSFHEQGYYPEIEIPRSPKEGDQAAPSRQETAEIKPPKESSTTQGIKEATEKTAKTIDDFIDSSGPAAGLSVRTALEKQVDDALNLPGGEVKSVNPEVEERFQKSKGITQKSIKERLKERLVHMLEQRKHFPGLDYKKDAKTILILREFENIPEFSKKTAAEITSGIVAGMGPKKYDVFIRNIILPDMIKDIDNGLYEDRDLPFGYKDKAEIQIDLDNFRKIAEANPDIMAALKRRNEFNAVLKSQLVENELLPKEVLEDDAYFHHQVLMYMEARSAAPGVSSKDVRTHTKGFQRGRQGSSKDFNTEYIESEFEYIAQAIAQLKTVETLKKIRTSADIALEVKKQAKEQGLENWRQAIPEEYTVWQPKPGTIFYKAVSIPEKLVDEIMSGKMAEVSKEDLHSIIAKGARNPEWVIPERLAKTLDRFRDFPDEGFDRFVRSTMSSWKQWVLINPLRILKYNINNASGDFDIAMAYDPHIMKYFRDAVSEAWGHYKGRAMTKDMREALEYGVIGSGISLNEIPDIKEIGVFRILTGTNSGIVERYWEKSKGLTSARENIIRIAAYKYFKEQIAAGKKVYGASIPELVDAERDPNRKAALLARDLIGDYGNISKAGQWLRDRMIPFFSWMEINAPRYVRMVRNLAKEEQSGTAAAGRIGAVVAGKAAKTTAKFAVKASGLYALVMLWNAVASSMLDIGDDEDRALYQGRDQLHIILGRRDDGTIITMRFQGAFSDMLDWAGLGNAPADIKDLATGRKTSTEQLKDMGKAPINRIVNASHPMLKTAGEIITGKSIYPDVFKPKPIRDRTEHALRAITADLPYRYITGKPKRGLSKDILGIIAYSNDPAEAAYWNTRKKVYEFLEGKGQESYGYTPTKRSNAMYYFKQAKRFGDEKVEKKYLREYVNLGGSVEGYKRSMENGEPLASLGKKFQNKNEFKKSLNAEEKRDLEIAVKWYKEHMTVDFEDIQMIRQILRENKKQTSNKQ